MAGYNAPLSMQRNGPSLRRALEIVSPDRLAQAKALLRVQGITPDRFGSLYRQKLQEFAGHEAGALADQAGAANLAENQKFIDAGANANTPATSPDGTAIPRPAPFRRDINPSTVLNSPFEFGSLGSRSDFGSLYRPIRRY
jgi:hypothetical protein